MEKSTRPVRNRRHSRRVWPPGDTHRPVKRLFTPEIKRMLKDWLVRRRDNPYPSRDEKKALAYETGLTYTQICNWFANWRRKLKNSGKEPSKKTWGHLIKNYNSNARGNVEQFSICSSDSIWGDDDGSSKQSNSPIYSDNYEPPEQKDVCDNINNNCEYYNREQYEKYDNSTKGYFMDSIYYNDTNDNSLDHSYTPRRPTFDSQCFQISSTTADIQQQQLHFTEKIDENISGYQPQAFSFNKYKHQMMEKYLRDTNGKSSTSSPELSKWLESAANFTPNKNNYIEWNTNRSKSNDKRRTKLSDYAVFENSIHQKEELDAAEALANLACNYRQRIMNSTTYSY